MKFLLISVFSLMVVDIVLTYWGIKVGYIEEGNILIKYLMTNLI